jgi:hypothetical protein
MSSLARVTSKRPEYHILSNDKLRFGVCSDRTARLGRRIVSPLIGEAASPQRVSTPIWILTCPFNPSQIREMAQEGDIWARY